MSSDLAKQYHSITFDGEKNTYDSWFLIPSSRPFIAPPQQKVETVSKAGAHGVIDLSEVLTGEPVFENRTGSLEFYVENDHRPWHVTYTMVMNYLNGRVRHAIFDDDPSYYYEGRFRVNQFKSDKWWSVITIDYDVFPFKYELIRSDEDWLWDPFNFYTGVIRNYSGITMASGNQRTIIGSPLRVIPIFRVGSITSGTPHIRYYDDPSSSLYVDHALSVGDNVFADIIVGDGEHKISVAGGTVSNMSVIFRGGML